MAKMKPELRTRWLDYAGEGKQKQQHGTRLEVATASKRVKSRGMLFYTPSRHWSRKLQDERSTGNWRSRPVTILL